MKKIWRQRSSVSSRDVEAEAEAVKFLWERKHFEETSWKQPRKHLTFWGAGIGNIFHKTWDRGVEAEANSKATNSIRRWKRKHKIFYCFHIHG